MVGLDGFEPSTSRLSGVRSDQAELQAQLFPIASLLLCRNVKDQKKTI